MGLEALQQQGSGLIILIVIEVGIRLGAGVRGIVRRDGHWIFRLIVGGRHGLSKESKRERESDAN